MSNDETKAAPQVPAETWNEWVDMINHCLQNPDVNASGKQFARGCKLYLDAQGYISDRQRATLKVIYDNSFK